MYLGSCAGEGEHVADSPYPIKVLPGPPSARHSTVTGAGKYTATAGATAEFTVEVRDAYGNGFELQEATGHLLGVQVGCAVACSPQHCVSALACMPAICSEQ